MDQNRKWVYSSYKPISNILINSSFEDFDSSGNPLSWTRFGQWNIIHDAIYGKNCLELVNSESYFYQTRNVTLTTIENYTISAFVKRSGSTLPVIYVRCSNSSGQTKAEYTYNEDITQGEWQRVIHTFSVPATTTTIYVRIGGTIANNDNVRFDAVKLEKGAYSTPYDTGGKLLYKLDVSKNAGTQATWFNFSNSSGTERDIITNKSTNGAELKVYTGSDNKLKLGLSNSAGTLVDLINTNTVINANTWYYTALRWSLSDSALTCYLDLNGTTYTASTTDFKDFSEAITGVGCSTDGVLWLNGMLEGFCYAPGCLVQTDISSMYQTGRGVVVNNKYDAAGRLTSNKLYTGALEYVTSYSYCSGYNGSSTNLLGTITNNGSSISYTYDNNGNIATITRGGQTIQYYYNELNELIHEDNPVLNKTITYAYNAGGNFTGKIEYPYTVGTPANPTKTYTFAYDTSWKDKMTSYDGNAITYDAIGNPLTYSGNTYTWEMGRQLAGISGNGNTITYKYNDSGIRTQKTVNGVTTQYHLTGDAVTYETNGTDAIYYTYDANGKLISMNLNGTEYFYIRNGQNDIIGLFDSTGTQVVTYTYNTWGKLISITGSLASTVGVKNPYRYRGYRYDTETGFYYCQSRYYNPEWGRWLNADDIDNGQMGVLLSCNLFAYCYNNPVNMVDSDGDVALPLLGLYFVPGVGEVLLGITAVGLLCYGAWKAGEYVGQKINEAKNKPVNLPSFKKLKIDMEHI